MLVYRKMQRFIAQNYEACMCMCTVCAFLSHIAPRCAAVEARKHPVSRISKTPISQISQGPRGRESEMVVAPQPTTLTPLHLHLHSTPALHRHPPTRNNTETALPRAANPLQGSRPVLLCACWHCIICFVGEKATNPPPCKAREESNFLPGEGAAKNRACQQRW